MKGPLDVLVNNSGVYTGSPREIWAVNVRGPLLLTRALTGKLAKGARVVMVTSGLGALSSQSESLVRKLQDPGLGFEDILALCEQPPGGYGPSKAALNALTRLFARELPEARVNAVDPGWVRTDMGGPGAPRSVEQGAASVLWGCRLPADGPTGGGRDEEGRRWRGSLLAREAARMARWEGEAVRRSAGTLALTAGDASACFRRRASSNNCAPVYYAPCCPQAVAAPGPGPGGMGMPMGMGMTMGMDGTPETAADKAMWAELLKLEVVTPAGYDEFWKGMTSAKRKERSRSRPVAPRSTSMVAGRKPSILAWTT